MVERPPAALVGRDESLGRLRSALGRAADGCPSVVLLTGETGVGKTRLVRELLTETGAPALVGASVPMAGDPLPFAPLTQGLRRLAGSGVVRQQLARSAALAQLVPGARPLPGARPGDAGLGGIPSGEAPVATGRLELFQEVLDLLALLGSAQPAVHVIEDIHWADRSTLDLLRFLAVNLSTERVVLVVTYRVDAVTSGSPLAAWLAEVGRLDISTRIALDRLGPEDTALLTNQLLGAVPDPAVLQSTLARSAGNPLFVEHLVLHGSSHGPLPETLRELLAARVAALPPPSQDLLRACAVLGRSVTIEVLAATLREATPAVETRLRPALDQHILEQREDGRIGFRHPAFSEVVYAALLPTEEARLHRAAALALEQDAASPGRRRGDDLEPGAVLEARAGELARHWLHAGDLPRALDAAVAGGQQAERIFAFADAKADYARAAELAVQVTSQHDRVWLLGRAADCASLVGDSAEAIQLGEQAVALAQDPHVKASLCERLASFHYIAGRGDESEQWFRQALELLPEGEESVLAARVLAGLALFGAAWSRLDEAQVWSDRALRLARATGARREEGRAQNAAGLAAASRGDTEAGEVHLRQALVIAREVGNPDDLAGAFVNLSHVLGLAGKYAEVVEVCREGTTALTRVGLGRQSGSLLRANASEALITSGRLEEARTMIDEAMAQHPRGIMVAPVLMQAGRLALHTGDLNKAWDLWERARVVMESEGAPDAWLREATQGAVAVELWGGRPEAAYELAIDGLHAIAGTDEEAFGGMLAALGLRALADQAEKHRDRGTRAKLSTLAEPLLEAAARSATEGAAGRALTSWHAAERSRLELSLDPALWARTAHLWEAAKQPYLAAYALWREAEARLDAGSDAAAIDALRMAQAAAEACGATLLQGQVELLARWHRIELGVDVPDQPQEAREASEALDTYGLTARELEVLGRLAAGRTNGEIARELFISVKTASVHVSNILRKLDVSGRQEAARVAHRLGVRS